MPPEPTSGTSPGWEPGKVVVWKEPLERRVGEVERLLKLLELRTRREAECGLVNMEENDKQFIGFEHEVKSLRRRVRNLKEWQALNEARQASEVPDAP